MRDGPGGSLGSLTRGPQFDAERPVPEEADSGNLAFSLRRYEFGAGRSQGRIVLDAGCGTGYGSALVAATASWVIGVDCDPRAVAYAARRYRRRNLAFVPAAVAALPFHDQSFDLVVSFEVVEHLPTPRHHHDFFAEVTRVLRRDGLFIVSTSNREVTVPHQTSVGIHVDAHLTEMDADTFQRELESGFRVESFTGMRYRGNKLYGLLRALDPLNLRLRLPPAMRESLAHTFFGVSRDVASSANVVISPDQLRQADHFLAVCRPRHQ